MSNAQQIPLVPLTEAEAYFGLLYGSNMQPYPRRYVRKKKLGQKQLFDRERQWVFVGGKEYMKSMATLSTLYGVLSDSTLNTTYYTPNGYYRRDERLTDSLRWLNAYVFDLDTYGESLIDVFDRTDRAGLPRPTAVVKTPSGGYHVKYLFSEPVRATSKTITLYTAIMGHMAEELGSDPYAVGANRIFRTPTMESLVYFNPDNRYDFDVFKGWRDLNHPFVDYGQKGNVYVDTRNLMSAAAVLQILHNPCRIGYREQTCFTLALAMKAGGWDEESAKSAIQEWHRNYCEHGGKESFSKRDALYKVHYVYQKDSLHAPSAEVIRELSGLPFYYSRRTTWEGAKARQDRVRSHIEERRGDLLSLLEKENEISGTQADLSDRLNCPLSTYKLIVKDLVNEGLIYCETQRGRGGSTTIWLVNQEGEEDIPEEEKDVIIPDCSNAPKSPITIIFKVDFKKKAVLQRIEVVNYKEIQRPENPRPPD